MTDPGSPGAGAAGAPKAVYSKDYWDIVLSQMGKRPSVWISLVILALLYGIAIYAPFLASDRPLVVSATDAASYRKAQKLLVPIASNFRGVAEGGRVAHAAKAAQGAKAAGPEGARSFEEELAAEHDAVALRIDTMREQLAAPDRALLDELGAQLGRARDLALAGNEEGTREAAAQVAELAKRAKAELSPVEEGAAPEPGRTVALVANTKRPLLDAISGVEVYFMALWAFVLLWPLWNRAVNAWLLAGSRERIRGARRRKLLVMVLVPLLPALFWPPAESAFQTSPWKEGLTKGDITSTLVVFPPVPFGLAEINDSEYFRPPTWAKSSEINADGRYVRGARAQKSDRLTGFEVPVKPVEVRAGEPERNAAGRHVLGTDSLGRDILARMIWGGRISLSVGLVSTLFLVLIGVVLGALAGYWGGWVDLVISRLIEIFQCFPSFFLILIVVAFLGPGLLNIMVILGITRWPGIARLVRGEFLRLREQDFVVASEALGVRPGRTIFRHVLPNAMGPVLVAATFSVASGILTESALSFLGFGIQLPIPSWGSLLIESRAAEHWWIQIFPGLLIFLTVLLYNLLGEGVRDALDPRLKS